MKTCTGCKLSKPLTEFNRNNKCLDGLHYRCRACANASTRKSQVNNRAQTQLSNSQWKKKNPRKVKKDNRKWRLENYYNITEEQYNAMFLEQEGKCAICCKHRDELKVALAVDHNHQTGKIRKLLCRACNSYLGYIKENVDAAINLADYIKVHNANLIS